VIQLDGIRNRYWRNAGDGRWEPAREMRSLPAIALLDDPGTSFADLEGNGTADLLVTGVSAGYYPNLGNGAWGRFQRFREALPFYLGDPNTRLVDLDADGVLYVLRTAPSSFMLYKNLRGRGWARPVTVPRVRDRERFPDIFLADPHVQLADMNGDGLADLVLIHSGEVSYWPYEGFGRWGSRRTMAHPPVLPRGADPRRVLLADVNGDGFIDILFVDDEGVTLWLNQMGDAFAPPVHIRRTPFVGGAQVRAADMLGAGTPGVLWTFSPATSGRANYKYLDLCGGEKPYLLTVVNNGLGRRTEITYSTSSRAAAADRAVGRTWSTFLPFPVQVVASIRQICDHGGPTTTTTIRYHDGMYDGVERRFAGFAEVDIEEAGDASAPSQLTTVRFDQTLTTGLDARERARAVARWGRQLEMTQHEGGTTAILRRATMLWDAEIVAAGADARPIIVTHRREQRVEVFGGSDGPLVTKFVHTYDDDGNVTREEYSANGPTPLFRATEFVYVTGPDGRRLAQPASVTDFDKNGERTREVRFYYDGDPFVGLPLGHATRGRVTRQSLRILSAAAFTEHYGPQGFTPAALGYRVEDDAIWTDAARVAYDAHGNIVGSRKPLGEETEVTYDADGVFMSRLTDPAGHIVRLEYDDRASQPFRVTGPNGESTEFAFDSLGRVVATARPGESLVDPGETIAYQLDASPPFVDITTVLTDAPRVASHRRVFWGGNGAPLQSRTSDDGDQVIVSPATQYNARGMRSSVGQPTFGVGFAFADSVATPRTTFRYDALGQLIGVKQADRRETRRVYEPFRTVRFDGNDTDDSPDNLGRGFFNTPTVQRLDGWGRLTDLTEMHDDLLTTHSYEYDMAGRLTAVRGPSGVVVRQTFDLAGNRLRIDHRDCGTRTLYWDAAGRPVLMVDAEGHRVGRSYDPLDRPLRTTVDGVDVHVLHYDSTDRANQLTRLSRIEDESGQWDLDYDARGRLTARTLQADGQSFRLGFRYGRADLTEGITYPDNTMIGFEYSPARRLVRVPGVIDELRYNARGQRTLMRHANGVETNLKYEEITGFLTRMQVRKSGADIYEDVGYERDREGNVQRLTDGRIGVPDLQPRAFTYDSIYRLRKVAAGGVIPYTRNYAYDRAGTITQFPTRPGDTFVCAPPDSALLAGVLTGGGGVQTLYTYDANGCMKTLPGRTLQFDPLGRLRRVRTDDGREVQYVYSMAGELTWRIVSANGQTDRTLFLGGLFEQNGASVRRYLADHSMLLGVEQSGARTYFHANDLGHVGLLTDAAGALVSRRVFHPFGELNGGALGAGPAFGGKSFDEISGLYFFHARHYAPEIGRFTSPDPFALMRPDALLGRPQLLNVYAFAGNNPLVYMDPLGLSLLGSILGGFLGAIVGAIVLVISGGNPILAGLAGGFVGGAVSGAIDGGVKGMVIGGLMGGLTGALGGAVLWGASLIGTAAWGASSMSSDILVKMVSSIATGATAGVGLVQGITTGNWDLLAGMAAGLVGGIVGYKLGNLIMMKGVYSDPNNSPRVRAIEQEYQQRMSRGVPSDVQYNKAYAPPPKYDDALGSEQHHVITYYERNIGDDYLQLRETTAHELTHHVQEHTIANFDTIYEAEKARHGYWQNAYEVEARAVAAQFMNYIPSPTAVIWIGQPLQLGLTTSHDLQRALDIG
jgi:RHS repeat-associated protein